MNDSTGFFCDWRLDQRNGYSHRKRNRWPTFNSWTRLFAFLFFANAFGKGVNTSVSLPSSGEIVGKTDYFSLGLAACLGKEKHWFYLSKFLRYGLIIVITQNIRTIDFIFFFIPHKVPTDISFGLLQLFHVVWINSSFRDSVWTSEFDKKHMKKAEGYIGQNVVSITIKMRSIVLIYKVITISMWFTVMLITLGKEWSYWFCHS